MRLLKKYLPILTWLPNYTRKDFLADLPAGLTVGVMLIPQGIAYALIAKLPPIYGLYAALLPQIIYAIFGTSRQLAVGPVAMDSLIVAAGITAIANVSEEQYIFMAIALAFMMGAIQFILGVFRLGFLVSFLSRPVISGFTSAAAIIIGLNQVKHLFGTEIERSNQIHILLYNTLQKVTEINLPTFLIGIITIVLIVVIKKINKKIPTALVVVVLGIIVVQFFGLDAYGVKIVKDIPEGLPGFSIPTIDMKFFSELFTLAATLALIAFMEAISVAKAVEERHDDYKVDPNQELIALGLGNIVGAMFQSYPTTGGFSRTAVNDESGARTNMAAVISAAVVALTLLFLTPLFYYLPKSVLAAIIMVAVYGLIDFKYPKELWNYKKDDLLMLITTFIVTLTIGIKEGILMGVLLSLVLLIYRSARPHIAQCEQIEGTNYYRNKNRFDNVNQNPEVLIIRLDGQLYFANIEYFKDQLFKMIAAKGKDLKIIVWNAEAVNHIDSSAVLMLRNLIAELREKDLLFAVAGANGPVRDILFKSGLAEDITKELMFAEVQKALECIESDTHADLQKKCKQIALQRN
ncbi:MAG: sulfate permease [Flavobacteriales bacterium]|jgi:SulP family sulfate permease|nr:sulfate permease [Flavobacteriales bacterium]